MKLILITLVAVVVGLMVACESASRTSMFIPTTTPPGPAYSEEEAMAVLKEHLQTKMFPGEPYPCLLVVDAHASNPSNYWVASYDTGGRLWNITIKSQEPTIPSPTFDLQSLLVGGPTPAPHPKQPRTEYYTWSVYERTGSIVATGDDPINQMC
jgi:hypothetical protein